MTRSLEILSFMAFIFLIILTGVFMSSISERLEHIEHRQKLIEKNIEATTEEIKSIKTELVLFDSVCSKVMENEW